jgi:DNA polymerase/3'-5' exonuclease PolX
VNPSVKITEEELLANLKKRVSFGQTVRNKGFGKSEAEEILRRQRAKLAEFNRKS